MSLRDVPFGNIKAFNVIVEIPTGSEVKYEYDENIDEIKLDWVFSGGFQFPFNYGFIPQTKGGDGDHLDAFILNDNPLHIGSIIECRAIGIIELLDRGEEDNKILAVPVADPSSKKYQSIDDLPKDYLEIFKKFFKELGVQKNKTLEIKGFHDAAIAKKELKKSNEAFSD